jgi:hypothetical protein
LPECLGNPDAKTANILFFKNDPHSVVIRNTEKQNINTQTGFGLFGGTTPKTFTLELTNQRGGHEQEVLFKRD